MNMLTNGLDLGRDVAPGGHGADPALPLTVAHCRHGDAEFAVGGNGTACLTLILSEGQVVERKSGGAWSHRPSRIGMVTVTDPDELTNFRIRGQANVAKLFIPVTSLADAAGLNRHPNVKARFIEREPDLARCAQRALTALHEGEGSDRLLLSSIVMTLSRTLVEQPARSDERAVGGLPRRQLRRVEELIEAHLSAQVASSPSLSELATEANLSLHHFAREFKRTMGVTPYAYMLRRRLERARRSVIQSTLPLAQVGRLSGFPSGAHFADRFRREMGVSPGALRRAAQGLNGGCMSGWRDQRLLGGAT